MQYRKGIVATTHLDLHNERFALSALEGLVEQATHNFIPVNIEHDPRKPTIGRIVSTEIKELEDGEYGVEATLELFDSEEDFEVPIENEREMKIEEHNFDTLDLTYDRSYQNPEDQKLIAELNDIIKSNVEPQFHTKKAAEPISLLQFGGGFILGCIASGFFNQIGADSWEFFKEKLKAVFSEKEDEETERLLSFDFTIEKDGYIIDAQVILTNPKDKDIEQFLDKGLEEVDNILMSHFKPEIGLKKIVMEYSDKSVKVKFGIRKDAIPIPPEKL